MCWVWLFSHYEEDYFIVYKETFKIEYFSFYERLITEFLRD